MPCPRNDVGKRAPWWWYVHCPPPYIVAWYVHCPLPYIVLRCSDEALERDVHILRHPEASMPDGMAEPCIHKTVSLMVFPSRLSKIIGWNRAPLGLSSAMQFWLTGFPSGCLLLSSSSTVHSSACPVGGSTRLWGDSGPPSLSSVMSFRVAFVLAQNSRWAKALIVLALLLWFAFLSLIWIALPSCIRFSMSPFLHMLNLLLRQETWSLVWI